MNKPNHDAIKLAPAQYIIYIVFDPTSGEIQVKRDGRVPPSNGNPVIEKKLLDYDFTCLCNGIAKMIGHMITTGSSRVEMIKKFDDAITNWVKGGGKLKKSKIIHLESANPNLPDLSIGKNKHYILYIVYEPETGKLEIRRDGSIPLPGKDDLELQKELINKDFTCLSNGMAVMIATLADLAVPMEKLMESFHLVINTYLDSGSLNGNRATIIMTSSKTEDSKQTKPTDTAI